VYALVNGHFHLSEACRKVSITKKTLYRWMGEEPEFRELVDEIQWHKKNFFEAALCKQVAEGNAAVIIHANKTVNRDRGYGTEVGIDVGGRVDHKHEHFYKHGLTQEELDAIPAEVKKALLEVIRRRQETQGAPRGATTGGRPTQCINITASRRPCTGR
jgi:hypothetical protein